jgi:hypothetical protein
MPDYKNGKIYKIVNDKLGLTYYGSTTQILSQRMGGHIACKKKYDKGEFHNLTSFQLLDGNQKIYLVEKYPCNDKNELERRERYYIENNDCVNKCIPSRNLKEYYIDNKDKIKELHKEYKKNNKDKINEYLKQYQKDNKDKNKEYHKEYYKNNQDKFKEYKKDNKDKINEYMKEYQKQYQKDNKDKIKEYRKEYYKLKKLKCIDDTFNNLP